jgi:hypothetical protein
VILAHNLPFLRLFLGLALDGAVVAVRHPGESPAWYG